MPPPRPRLQVGLEKIATEDTRLVYMTTGVLLQKVVSAKSLTEFTHIFIDEVGAPGQEGRSWVVRGRTSECGVTAPKCHGASAPLGPPAAPGVSVEGLL